MYTFVQGNRWFKLLSFHDWNCGERCAHFIQDSVEDEKLFIPIKINKNKKMIARTATYLGV